MSANLFLKQTYLRVLLLGVMLQFFCIAASIAQHPENFDLKQLGVNEGISHSDVTAIVQDRAGYLWIGTNNGLNKYDGNKIKIFKSNPADTYGLPESRIARLLHDSRGRLWIGMQYAGLCYYDSKTEKFQRVNLLNAMAGGPGKKALRISDIAEDQAGNVWVSVKKIGLFVIGFNKAGRVSDIKYKRISQQTNYYMPLINCMTLVAGGKALLGTDRGLFVYDSTADTLRKLNFQGNNKSVAVLHKDRQGNIWIGNKSGLYYIRSGSKINIATIVVNAKTQIPLAGVRALYQDVSGTLWVGTQSMGVYRITAGYGLDNTVLPVIPITDKNSKTDFIGGIERINCFYEDRYGLIWIGTSGGGAGFYNTRQRHIGLISNKIYTDALPDNYITAVNGANGEIWIGTHKGISIRNPQGIFVTYLKGDIITDIYREPSGIYWVATRFNGLKKFVPVKGKYAVNNVTIGSPLNGRLVSNEISCLTEDSWGRLWVASFSQGISIFSPNGKRVIQLAEQSEGLHLTSNHISAIYRDPAKPWMWVSTKDAGLMRIELGKEGQINGIKSYEYNSTTSNSISSNNVWPVLRTNDSTVWIGTLGGGLNKLITHAGKENITRYTIANGLYDNDIEAIEADAKGNLWLAGYGITKFNPDQGLVAFFDHNDGMQSNAFKVGASFKDVNGWLYFGGINGLNYFNPDSVGNQLRSPDLLFTGLKVFNKPVGIGKQINGQILLNKAINFTSHLAFSAAQNDFTIEFAGLQFAVPTKVKYYYKLEPYSPEWTETDVPSASFSNLPGGSYKFKVYASSNGIRSKTRVLYLKISPPWYFTWWAFIIYVLLVGVIFYIYRRVLTKESRLKNELMLAEKDKLLQADKMDFFTNISHELRTPLSLIYGPVTDLLQKCEDAHRDKLWLVYRNTKRLMTLTNQLLDFRKMDSGKLGLHITEEDMVTFTRDMWRIFKDKSAQASIAYHFSTELEKIKLHFDKEKMELVITNLLSNAFKFSKPGGAIHVNIYLKGAADQDAVFQVKDGKQALMDNYVEIVIEDSGIGIPQQELDRIFDTYYQAGNANSHQQAGTGLGLAIAKGIVEMHKGFISAESRLGQGARFIVAIPLGKSHFDAQTIFAGNADNAYAGIDSDLLTDRRQVYVTSRGDLTTVAERETSAQSHSASKGWKMLIVEDNDEILNYLKNSFSGQFKIVTAKNGCEGLEKARVNLPDIIISDVMMPQMDGLEMCRRLKADPEINFIPVILLTARTAPAYEMEGIATGADDYITKPFNIQLLGAKINNFIQARLQLKEYYSKLISLDAARPNINSADEAFVDKMVALVEANLTNKDFNVTLLAQELAMSKSTMFKRVKDITGSSPVDFIRGVRMRKSASLLLSETLNINEIAASVGINDLKYFREQFKKHFGASPRDYLKQQKAKLNMDIE